MNCVDIQLDRQALGQQSVLDPFTRSVLSRAFMHNDVERWLIDWHDRRAGATSQIMVRGKPSSYEWLAEQAQVDDQVLDLACGDGLLLDLLHQRGVDQVIGLDMSPGELAAARARLGPDAPLVRGRAQQLPFPDGSFDLVTCHLALMLMTQVDEVLSEVRRVLRPGGRFAFVVTGGGIVPGDVWARFLEQLMRFPLAGPPIGDPRTVQEEGLRELFSPFARIEINTLAVDLSSTPDQMWDLLVQTYPFDMVVPSSVDAFEQAVRGDWPAMMRPDGTLPCTMTFFVVTAVRG